ncbi:MAG: right-handed parallel beta-helix repeat-containing protein, partial [Armatimonadetes bacterium]|nr:right-handed parallel beta-helix repeat-containing protein [Armatimonadota bacterium]
MFRTVAILTALACAVSAHTHVLVVDQRHPQAADTNDGTPAAPLQTIGAAARLVEPGDTVLVRSGTYREAVVIERGGTAGKPVIFRADLAANVVVTGADVLDRLRQEPGEDKIFSVEWPHVFIGWNPTRAHPADDYHRLVGRCEQVFVDGYALRPVLAREQLARGTCFVDEPGKRLYLWGFHNGDLTKRLVEASTRSVIWDVKAPYVHTRGLRFRYAANMAQHGAVALRGQGNVLEDVVCERMNSIGASLVAPDLIVRRCTFADNGQMGFSAGGAHNLLFTGCVVRNNNLKGWSRGWEAGGDKLCLSRGVVIEQSQFLDNRGNGIWFDIGNEYCTVRNCLIADNEDAGIFYEISYGLHAHDNVIIGNGFAVNPGAWGAQAAISLSSSPGCVIERNLMIG